MKKAICNPYRREGRLFALPLAVFTMGLLPYLTAGLTCYECLSLSCDSGAICESIKEIMVKIFVPKSHLIHFDPREPCPESENPFGNSTFWANFSRECHRSDSLCLVAPIEVQTTFDGTKSEMKLESSSVMSSVGYLRGCASRRKLLEQEDTIKVVVSLTDDSSEGAINANASSISRGSKHKTNSSHSHDNHRHQQSQQNAAAMNDAFTGGGSNGQAGSGATQQTHNPLLNNRSFGDGYVISKIYSHIFYIDQGTSNATRCYMDNCNNRIKAKRSGAGAVSVSGMRNVVYATVATNCFLCYYLTHSVHRIMLQ